MKVLIFLTIYLRFFLLQIQANECELTFDSDDQEIIDDKFFQPRILCSQFNLPTKHTRRVSITGRLVDYTTQCQRGINNGKLEIIRMQLKQQSICYEVYYANQNGYFNLSDLKIMPYTEKVFLQVTAPGYKTVHREIHVPLSKEHLIYNNWQIVLTVQSQENLSVKDQRMKSIVDDLLANMTLMEKIGQLNLVSVGFDQTGPIVSQNVSEKIKHGLVGSVLNTYTPNATRQLQELAVNSTRLKIPLIFGFDVIHGHKTIFPVPLGLSATWDLGVIEQSARIAAQEASADGINWVYSPMVDIARDPRWGRIMEGAGEDPWLGGQIAAAMVRGYQGNDLTRPNTVMACFKHFALYGGAEAGRDYNTVDMSPVKMYEYYLQPYRAAVEAGAGSVMTSFNDLNGVPSSANQWLLTDLLREQWKFDGFVVTDYTAVNELISHGLGDLQEVSARSINAGVDVDMVGEGFLTTLNESLQQGKITEQTINQACRRVLEAKYRLGLLDDPFRYVDDSRPQTDIFTDENRLAARDFARRSFVLLKNDKQVLPLARSGRTIALVGPLADDHRNLLGAWCAAGNYNSTVSVREGIDRLVGSNVQVLHAKGSNLLEDPDLLKLLNAFGGDIVLDNRTATQMIDEAVEIAKKSDVVVAVVGETQGMTGEASSRANINIPACQQRLLQALFATGKPVVVVLMNGRPLTIAWESQYATAILETWFAGTEAGNAIAEVLFGYYNPAGKLTATFPLSVGQIPIYYNHKNTGRPYNSSNFYDRYRVKQISFVFLIQSFDFFFLKKFRVDI